MYAYDNFKPEKIILCFINIFYVMWKQLFLFEWVCDNMYESITHEKLDKVVSGVLLLLQDSTPQNPFSLLSVTEVSQDT